MKILISSDEVVLDEMSERTLIRKGYASSTWVLLSTILYKKKNNIRQPSIIDFYTVKMGEYLYTQVAGCPENILREVPVDSVGVLEMRINVHLSAVVKTAVSLDRSILRKI